MNLIAQFTEIALALGEKSAIVSSDGRAISFRELDCLSGKLAATWREEGIEPGDRVLIAMPVGIDLYAAIAALWRIGAVIVFPEPALGLAGLKHAVDIAKPRAFLASSYYRLLRVISPQVRGLKLQLVLTASAQALDETLDVSGEHPALISFTSGSTGRPKGILRSHGFLNAQNECLDDLLASERDNERDLVAFPVFVIANLGRGVTSVLPSWRPSRGDKLSAKMLERFTRQHAITRMLVPPAVCESIVRSGARLDVKTIFTGGGPVYPDLMEKLLIQLPETELATVYGSTEAEPIAHLHVSELAAQDWEKMKAGAGLLAGKAHGRCLIKLRDGEILVAGDHVNKGYIDGRGDAENKLNLDGQIWHRTGDVGTIDDQGRLWLLGRHSAKSSGAFPFQIETIVRFWPGVSGCALVPRSNPPVIAIEGREPRGDNWEKWAFENFGAKIAKVKKLPLDRRHRSKIDYVGLEKLLKNHSVCFPRL